MIGSNCGKIFEDAFCCGNPLNTKDGFDVNLKPMHLNFFCFQAL
uniref:Uncharacterized protein n=1 Tax=Rhizophora mucronata TaxID=61149 RepID=A0A2P2N2D3_RHIMU